ncbi:hypothetical protein Tco_1170290 [Tanacetum coccineum]
MIEPEKPLKKKDQIMLDQELAFKLQAEEEEEERIAREKAQKVQEANIAWDDIQAKKLFDKEMKRVNIFVDMDVELVKGSEAIKSEVDRAVPKLAAESSKRIAEEELDQESFKRQKTEGIAIDATKPPIIFDWKILKEGKTGYFQIIRVDGSSKRYSSMIRMLQNIDSEDLETLWNLVKAKHGNIRPEEEYERVLWGDLKVMFEPDIESKVWRSPQGYRVIVWMLFDSCGVHFVRFQNLHIYMLVEKTYPLTPATITYMINKKLQVDHWNEMFSTAGTKVNAAGIKVTTAKRLQLLKDYN